MSPPLVTVVVATKNSERYLVEALDSVAAQTLSDYEVVVVDAGSTDRSTQIAESYPKVTCVAQIGTGFSDAWNLGIKSSQSPFISFLDSDDIWLPDKLASQVRHFESHPSTQYVIGRVRYFLEPNTAIPPGFKPSLLQGSYLAYMPGTSMVRRAVFETIGPFEDRWEITSDIVWFSRLRELGLACGILDEVVLRKRVHSNNLSYVTSASTYRGEVLRLLKESIDRRRRRPDDPGIA